MSIVEKLIPALPFDLRVAAMGQYESGDTPERADHSSGDATVLNYVAQSDTYRNKLISELAGSHTPSNVSGDFADKNSAHACFQ